MWFDSSLFGTNDMKFKFAALAASIIGLHCLTFGQSPDSMAYLKMHSSTASLPLSFEPNLGQTDRHIRFLSRGMGYQLFLTSREAIFAFNRNGKHLREDGESSGNPDLQPRRMRGPQVRGTSVNGIEEAVTVRMQLADSLESASIQGESKLPGIVSYIVGNDRSNWHTGVGTYGRVRYAKVYPGIDLVYHGEQGRLEYDFIVAPGGDSRRIKLRFGGMNGLNVDHAGNMILNAGDGSVVFQKPIVYQEIDGRRSPVIGRFQLLGRDTVGFSVGRYDHSKALVIDPVLTYSTYLGGGFFDAIQALAVDQSGSVYVTGVSDSCNFPTTTGTFEPALPLCSGGSQGVVFVSKLNPQGTGLVYSTFITDGKSVLDTGRGSAIAVDASGNAYVAGQAGIGFPVTPGAVQQQNNASNSGINAIIFKLNPTGTALVYSTYLGGSFGDDAAFAIAIDASGNAYVAGQAVSSDFPSTPGAFQTTDITPGDPYSFVAKLNASGTALLYSTYLMGDGTINGGSAPVGQATGIAVDGVGNAYVVGGTADVHFPVTAGAFQTAFSTNPSNLAAFRSTGYVTKFDPTGAHQLYSSYLGGGSTSQAEAIALDSAGNAYITGWTIGGNITTPGAFQTTSLGIDAYVVKVNPSGSNLVYSTYLGGTCSNAPELVGDEGRAIALDAAGNAYIAGQTCSQDFPSTSNAIQNTLTGTSFNAFLSVLNSSGSNLLFSTYIGGSSFEGDWANGIGLDGAGNAYIAGLTHANDFPTTTGAFQLTNIASDQGTGFVSQFTIPQGGTVVVHDFSLNASPSSATIASGQSTSATITLTPMNGFYESVSFSCSGLPNGASCNFSPVTIVPGTTTSTITLTLTTNSLTSNRENKILRDTMLAIAGLLGLFGLQKREKATHAIAVALFLGVLVLNGCGGGGGSGGGGGGGGPTSSTFTATIVGTSQSTNHTTSLTVTVN
jgi:Beta-propeller repeat